MKGCGLRVPELQILREYGEILYQAIFRRTPLACFTHHVFMDLSMFEERGWATTRHGPNGARRAWTRPNNTILRKTSH